MQEYPLRVRTRVRGHVNHRDTRLIGQTRRCTTELEHRRGEILEHHYRCTDLTPRREARASHDKWHVGGDVVRTRLSVADPMLTFVYTVVAREHHDCLREPLGRNCREDLAHHVV